MKRRQALKQLTLGMGAATLPIGSPSLWAAGDQVPWLKLAVQQYSFNHQLRSGELKIINYPKTVVDGTGIKALEYFNGHMEDKAGKQQFYCDRFASEPS